MATLQQTEVTLFAPTNAAFGSALAALQITQEQLDLPNLGDILKHHVVAGSKSSSQLGTSLTTLLGTSLLVVLPTASSPSAAARCRPRTS